MSSARLKTRPEAKTAPKVHRSILQGDTIQFVEVLNRVDPERKPTRAELKRSIQHLSRGNKLANDGQFNEAASEFLRAHCLDPSNGDTLLVLGNNLRYAGNVQAAIHAMERALEIAGEDPELVYGVGQLAQDLGMLDAAERMYALVIQRCPDDPRGPTALAAVKRAKGNYGEAIDTLKFAIEQKPSDESLWQALAVTVAEDRGADAARPFFDEALRLNPDYDIAWSNLGHAYSSMGRFEESLPFLKKAVDLRPDDADTHFSYASSLLGVGDLEEGWQEYEWRLDRRRGDSVVFVHDLPRWQGEDISDKCILVSDEQGIGDAIIFGSAYRDVIERAGHVIIECDRRLVSWFQRSFPEATVHRHVTFRSNAKIHRHYGWLKEDGIPKPDLFIPSGSIFGIVRDGIDSFARNGNYLIPDPERAAYWKAKFDAIGEGPKVGICWTGGYVTPIRAKGYMSLTDFAPFFDLQAKGAHFVNCMYKDASEDCARLAEDKGIIIHDFEGIDRREQLDEAAAWTAGLDFVVSISSSPVAIAGAMGIPAVTLLHKPDRFHFGSGIEPWFPNTDIFVAREPGEWPKKPCTEARIRTGERLGLD
ncbi:MAG: tetratricopeptide repeat protein [Minwuia sp.]|uniref:tetratricopeptide repeat protein n=1 Tax=Minwuia sp. TaxID=2493630 RepID=UPI003A8A8DC4